MRAIARWAERWRYKGEWDGDDPMAPRERVAAQLKEHVRSPPITLIHHQNESFPEVPVGPLKSYSWKTAYKIQLFSREAMHIKDMRGILAAVRCIVKDVGNHDQQHLILGDNLGLVLALSKGRCRDPKLLMLIRRLLALILIGSIRLHVRWLASEDNEADEASRFREPSHSAARSEHKTEARSGDVASSASAREAQAHTGAAASDSRGLVAGCRSRAGFSTQSLAGGSPATEAGWRSGQSQSGDSSGGREPDRGRAKEVGGTKAGLSSEEEHDARVGDH